MDKLWMGRNNVMKYKRTKLKCLKRQRDQSNVIIIIREYSSSTVGVVRTECVLMRSYMPYNFIMFKQSFYGDNINTVRLNIFNALFNKCCTEYLQFIRYKLKVLNYAVSGFLVKLKGGAV